MSTAQLANSPPAAAAALPRHPERALECDGLHRSAPSHYDRKLVSVDGSTATQERCDLHPGAAAVAHCDRCGRPMCLDCAVPVRGRALGHECLALELGPSVPTQAPPRRRRFGAMAVAGVGLTIALGTTALPWTRSSFGSGAFGAWGWSPLRWSLLAAVGGIVGVATWLLATVRVRPIARAARLVLPLFAVATIAGAGLHLWHPPAFTEPSLGPWICLFAGVAALAGALLLLSASRRVRAA